jgi:hypothetical protein
VVNNRAYLERLQLAVERLHNCKAAGSATVPVREGFCGRPVWQGKVEVFDLTGPSKTSQARAWSCVDGKDDEHEGLVAFLEILSVELAVTTGRTPIVIDSKKGSTEAKQQK